MKGTILKVLENLVRTGVEKRYFLSSCEVFEVDSCTVVPGKILHNFQLVHFTKSLHSAPNNTQFINFMNVLFVVETDFNYNSNLSTNIFTLWISLSEWAVDN